MASRHGGPTKYRDSNSNIKVLLRQQTNMTLNERFHKIMKMPSPAPARPRTPPRDNRLKEELKVHQRKLESLERNTLQMMSRSLATLNTPVPTAPVYEPPKQSAKTRLGRTGSAQARIGAKRLTQKYTTLKRSNTYAAARNSFVTTGVRGSRGTSRGAVISRGATRGTPRGSTRGAARGAARGAVRVTARIGTTRGRGAARGVTGGRGATRGAARGAGRGAGRGGKPAPADKDALDSELDKYMSKSRTYLDTQLDDYMAQKGGEKEATS